MGEDVMGEDLYAVTYGASSESVHGSWRDIRGYSLAGDLAHGFYPLYTPLRVNIGKVSMIVPFATLPFRGGQHECSWTINTSVGYWTSSMGSTADCSASTRNAFAASEAASAPASSRLFKWTARAGAGLRCASA